VLANLPLSQALSGLRDELRDAKLSADPNLKLKITSIQLDLTFEVETKAAGKATASFWSVVTVKVADESGEDTVDSGYLVAPGLVLTVRHVLWRDGRPAGGDHAALQRYGRPEEIAEVLVFCASERPGYLTGTDILCDCGATAGLTRKDRLAMARGK
jgi:hypothetical protein